MTNHIGWERQDGAWACACERVFGNKSLHELHQEKESEGGVVTLKIHDKIAQGSDEWFDIRRGIITASAVGKLITPKTIKPASNPESRGLAMLLAAERVTGWTDPTYVSDDMLRGQLDEPIARDLYSEHYAPVTEVGFMTVEIGGGLLGFSPDGLVGDSGLIEIKSRRSKTQLSTIIEGQVPLSNMAQCQAGLLVSGRQWLDYVSFCAGMPLYVQRVLPDPKWFEAIVAAVKFFEDDVTTMCRAYERLSANLHPTERTVIDDLEIVI